MARARLTATSLVAPTTHRARSRDGSPPSTSSRSPELLVRFHSLMAEATQVVHALARGGAESAPSEADDQVESLPASAFPSDGEVFDVDEELRELLERRMRRVGINQGKLAERMGVSAPVVSRILKRPSAIRGTTRKKLEAALECSWNDLLKA